MITENHQHYVRRYELEKERHSMAIKQQDYNRASFHSETMSEIEKMLAFLCSTPRYEIWCELNPERIGANV